MKRSNETLEEKYIPFCYWSDIFGKLLLVRFAKRAFTIKCIKYSPMFRMVNVSWNIIGLLSELLFLESFIDMIRHDSEYVIYVSELA